MTTHSAGIKSLTTSPLHWFLFGLAVVLLGTWFPFIPNWQTFIHMWRVEILASVFLFAALIYVFVRSAELKVRFDLSNQELWLVVFPIVSLILWSGLSVIWAPSWKSAVHHTLVWSEYLAYYILIRYLVDHERTFSRLLNTFAIVLVLFAVPALIEYAGLTVIGGEFTFRARFAKYGEQIATILPLLLVAVFRSSGRRFTAGIAILVALWLLVYCTAGRMNLFVFAIVFLTLGVLVFAMKRFQRYRMKFAVCVLALILAPVPLYLFSLSAGTGTNPIASRLADSSGNAYSTGFRSLMNSVSLEMLRSNPLLGVGADNYGFQYNNYRRQYASLNPGDPNLAWGEIGIVGQAHNEYLQIAAELGIVGLAIFSWFLVGLGVVALKALRHIRTGSLYPVAAILGLGMFLVSSLVSSYSFRLVQNGFVFFFVLAVATKILLPRKVVAEPETGASAFGWLRPALAAGLAASLLLAVYSGVRVGSVIITEQANWTRDLDSAANLYRIAMSLDDENPDVRNNFGKRYFRDDRFAESIPLLAESITIGRAESTDFSYLASAYFLSGESRHAEDVMRSASEIYPQSTFVLTRYADLLRLNGKTNEAASVLEKARRIDPPAANTWQTMLESGSQAASDRYFVEKDCLPIMDLRPIASIYAVLDERKVRFPEETSVFQR
jgi:O-antigen ligase